MEIGFDMGVNPDPLVGSGKPMQTGGIYRISPEKIEMMSLCSQDGIQSADTLVFYIVDISESGGDCRRVVDLSVAFSDCAYNEIPVEDVVTDIPKKAKNMGLLPSQFFGSNLYAYKLHNDSTHQFMVNYPEPGRLLMMLRIWVEDPDFPEPVEFQSRLEIVIH